MTDAERHKRWMQVPGNKERARIHKKKYRDANKAKIAVKEKERRKKNPEHHRRLARASSKRNSEARRNWYMRNRARLLAKHKERMRTDECYRMKHYLRARLRLELKGIRKSAKTICLLGCSVEDLWIYLESKFQSGMTRENYGQTWVVDHIMPCAIFDLSRPEHQKRCFHFSNLQPLFVRENWAKSDKVLTPQFNLI